MNNDTRHRYSRPFFMLLLVLVFFLTFTVIRPYFGVLVLSFIIAVLFRPLYLFFLAKLKDHAYVSLILTWISLLIMLLVPLAVVVNILFSQVLAMARDIQGLDVSQTLALEQTLPRVNAIISSLPGINYQLTASDVETRIRGIVAPLSHFLLNYSLLLGGASAFLMANLVIFIVLFSTFLMRYDNLIAYLKRISPLEERLDDMYIARVIAMAKSMVKGTLVIALSQAIVAGFLLWWVGVPYVLLWTVLMFFLGFIPLGAGLISIPIGVIFLLMGLYLKAVILIAGTMLVVNNLDNILRPKLVAKEAELHPALLLLGALGGITLFGLWGVIYGPVIMILLTTTLEIYLERY